VSGEGAGELPTGEEHLVARTMLATFDRLGARPGGFVLECANGIPQARGMGSSSAAIVAGILLARRLSDGGGEVLDDAAVIRLAAGIEGHPDNVAPCVLGGVTIAWTGSGGARAVRLPVTPGVVPVVFVPDHLGYTAHARAVLPENVPLADAAFNAARTALLTHALTSGAPDLLLDATEDRLHQDYRASAMPETAKLVAALRGNGVAAVVSGAGPAVLAIVPDDARRIADAEQQCPDGWWVRRLPIATGGAQVDTGKEG
jgi:homoserine kinase